MLAAPALAALLVFALALPVAGQKEKEKDWPPISAEEMALKDCAQQPGAPAIFLYREEICDDDEFEWSYFRRLKILTPAGKDRANIEIPFVKGSYKVEGLKARVVQPDGRSVEFAGQVFEKTAVRAGRLRTVVMTFALPDVEVGCIIDYKYKIVSDSGSSASKRSLDALEDALGVQGRPREGGIDSETGPLYFPAETWDIQEDLFTRKAKFSYVPSGFFNDLLSLAGMRMRLSWVTQRLAGAMPENTKDGIVLELQNVPALETEEYMPPESTTRMQVRIFYIEGSIDTPDKYWEKESANWQKGAEKFMRKAGDAVSEAKRLTEGLEDDLPKIRALYDRAQEIKNLSYDKTLTRRRREELKIKENKSVAEVLKRGYGVRSDITRTFVAMARAAGLEANVVRVVTRDDKVFVKVYCGLYSQFDSELAMVKIDGTDKLFDPATPFCPIGMVRWSCTGSVCLAPSDKPPLFLPTPAYPPDTALTQREIALTLDPEGNLAGTATVVFLGQEALVRRVEHIGEDEAEIRKDFETEMSELLPAGAKVTLKTLENIDNNKDSVVAHFEIGIAGLATPAGDKTLLPVSPLLGSRRHPFRHERRVHSVIFPYPYREFDDIVVTLPEGLQAETVPAARKKTLESFGYSLACGPEDGGKLHVQRDLVVKKSYFAVDQYKAVKAFFDEVTAGDEELVVLSAVKK
jgi:hypothetical protein